MLACKHEFMAIKGDYGACLDIVITLKQNETWRFAMLTQTVSAERRTEKLDVRVSRAAKAKLQAAASASHRTMSDFVMESALSRAEEMLAERRIFVLSSEKWSEFQKALDAPPRELPRLKALLNEPSVFESSHTS